MTILCATDRLPKSEAAIQRAGILAEQLSAQIMLLHIVVPGDSVRALEQVLITSYTEMLARARPPLWRWPQLPNVAVRTGTPARIIVETIQHSQPGLLVIGPHRKRPVHDVLEGTIAEKALDTRQCPVLIVRNDADSPYARALLALDLSEASASALRAAERLVLPPQVDAQIVHAHKPGDHRMQDHSSAGYASPLERRQAIELEAFHDIHDMLKEKSANFSRYQIHIEQHQPREAILRAVELFNPDLLVMGIRARGRLHRALLGSVVNSVLHEVTCDTLIVPATTETKSANLVPPHQRPSTSARSD